jgi:hypothetical protein
LPSARLFAESILSSTRKTTCLPGAVQNTLGENLTLDKQASLPSVENRTRRRHSANSRLCRVSDGDTRLTARAANGRQPPLVVCRVSLVDTQHSRKFAKCFVLTLDKIFFLSYDLQTFSFVLIQYLVLHVQIWYISRSFCSISLII